MYSFVSNKIEEICEGIMAFINTVKLSPFALSTIDGAITETIPSKAVSEEATPAILDVYDALHSN